MIMHSIQFFTLFRRSLFTVFLLSLTLSACDNKENKNQLVQAVAQKYTNDTKLTGKVTNKKGAVTSGEIKATDNSGKIVATFQLENSNAYALTIPAGTELPVLLKFYPNKEATEKDRLVSAVIYTSIKQYAINDLTTLIASKAKTLGGYSHSNMMIAADSTVGIPDANKTLTGFKGDPTKQYGGWH